MSMRFEPGAPVDGGIPLSVPEVRGNEWKYIKECLDTGWVSSVGAFVERFERDLAAKVNAQFAVASVTGTAALHVALLVAGVQPDDEVLVSTLTFIAPAFAVRYINAWPVLIDVEPQYWQMDPQRLEAFLKNDCQYHNGELRNKVTGRRVRAVLPVHILGHPCALDEIYALARAYGLVVVEDATESLGARYKDHPIGAQADIACFSFNGNKIITTGGGGMLVTNNEAWAHKARFLGTQAKDDPVEYIHSEVGFNYRLTNIQAAMGCAQLEQLDEYVQIKRRLAARYTELLEELPGITPMREAPEVFSTFWLFTALFDEQHFGVGSRAIMKKLAESGIQARPLWQPLHCTPLFRDLQHVGGEVAERLNAQALSLPCSVGAAPDVPEQVVAAIAAVRV